MRAAAEMDVERPDTRFLQQAARQSDVKDFSSNFKYYFNKQPDNQMVRLDYTWKLDNICYGSLSVSAFIVIPSSQGDVVELIVLSAHFQSAKIELVVN